MSPEPDIKTIWKSQTTEGGPMSLAEIHTHAARFEKRVRTRNAVEYVAAGVVAALFGYGAYVMPHLLSRLGSLAIVAATLFMVVQLHLRGAPRGAPSGDANVRDFLRQELVRQRDLFRSAWLWYALPFLPGMMLIFASRWLSPPVHGRTVALDHTFIVLGGTIAGLIFLCVILWQRLVAARLQNRIDDFDRS